MHKKTKIVATVGPASTELATLRGMVREGVDVFRINFSYGDDAEHQRILDRIRTAEAEERRPVAVCADLCGPKIRVGPIQGGAVVLQADAEIVIQRTPVEGSAARISTTFPELIDLLHEGQRLLLADGRLRLEVVHVSPPDECTCRVVVGGELVSGKGVNLPDTTIPLSPLTEKDHEDVAWIAARDVDYVALSFVQTPSDVEELRGLLRRSGSAAHVIAKIEKPRALESIDAIIDAADAVMVARGDLGVEMEYYSVPIAQKSITRKCESDAKPCIIATEMLESMIASPTPTRAEVSDVANAVVDHADAVMLSGESSVGKHPVESVAVMRQTVVAAEEFLARHGRPVDVNVLERPTAAALARVACDIVVRESVAAVAVFTASGTTARFVAKNRPPCPIVALSPDASVVRRACLYYGVVPCQVDVLEETKEMLQVAVERTRELGFAAAGDRIIVIAGLPAGVPDANALVVQTVA